MTFVYTIEPFGDGWRWEIRPEDDPDAVDAGTAPRWLDALTDSTARLASRISHAYGMPG